MLPMSMGTPPLNSPPTPEMLEALRKLRYCVMGIFVAAVGRFCTGDLPIAELSAGISGVFMLKDDDSMQACYACLLNSPLSQCAGTRGGGLDCIMPFLWLASFNCIFLALRLFTGGPFLLVSFCFQFAGSVFAWQLNQLVSHAQLAELGGSGQNQPLFQPPSGGLPLRGFPGGGGGLDRASGAGGGGAGGGGFGGRGGGRSAGGGAAGQQAPIGPGGNRFVAFQGSGQRLSDE